MAETTGISWTNATWNPVRGCERVSEGCRKCYAEVLAARHSYPGGWGEGIATIVKRPDGTKEARWTGAIRTIDTMLDAPLRWKKPRRIFVNSMSDLFHKDVPEDFIAEVFAVMARCQHHVFQILTKRPERMQAFCSKEAHWWGNKACIASKDYYNKPLPNVWLGVSAEDQDTFDERVPVLLQTPAAVRWVSLEPLLGHIDLIGKDDQSCALTKYEGRPALNWGVVGGESGSGYRPMDMQAARYIIRQFLSAKVPLFVKQDNGSRPGMQGRFTAEEWALKEFPGG